MNVWYNFAPVNEAQKYLLQSLSVAIVDDHALILEGFKSLMQGCGASGVETFLRAADLINTLPHHKFDIYIIDIGMPDIDGFELIDIIRGTYADARIIVNTIHEEIWLLRRMLDKDVNAIMFKSTDFMQMVDAITAVMHRRDPPQETVHQARGAQHGRPHRPCRGARIHQRFRNSRQQPERNLIREERREVIKE